MPADYKTLLGLVREFVDKTEDLSEFHIGERELMERARAAIAPSAPAPTNDSKILHIAMDDPCCSRPFQQAARGGALDNRMTWDCPKCGTEWKMVRCDGFTYRWEPRSAVTKFKL